MILSLVDEPFVLTSYQPFLFLCVKILTILNILNFHLILTRNQKLKFRIRNGHLFHSNVNFQGALDQYSNLKKANNMDILDPPGVPLPPSRDQSLRDGEPSHYIEDLTEDYQDVYFIYVP